jgi:hypothetical protein
LQFENTNDPFPALVSAGLVPGSLNGFSMTAGGGLDVHATGSVSLRLIQAQYSMHRVGGVTLNGLSLSTGAVFGF